MEVQANKPLVTDVWCTSASTSLYIAYTCIHTLTRRQKKKKTELGTEEKVEEGEKDREAMFGGGGEVTAKHQISTIVLVREHIGLFVCFESRPTGARLFIVASPVHVSYMCASLWHSV